MIVLRSMNQISEKFVEIFGKDFNASIDFEEFVFNQLPFEKMVIAFDKAPCVSKKKKELEEMCEMLFQIKDNKPSLCNFVKILLASKNYESVFYFMRRFIVGQFGNAKFSLSSTGLGQQGRLFERFLEVALFSDLKPNQFFPFIFGCLQSQPSSVLFAWKEPAKMFLQAVYESEKAVLEEFCKQDEGIRHLLSYEMDISFEESTSPEMKGYVEKVVNWDNTAIQNISLQNNNSNGVDSNENNEEQIEMGAPMQNESVAREDYEVETVVEDVVSDEKETATDMQEEVQTKDILENTKLINQSQNQYTCGNEIAKENELLTDTDLANNSDIEEQLANKQSITSKNCSKDLLSQSAEKSFLISFGVHSIEQFEEFSANSILKEQTFVFGNPISDLHVKFANGKRSNDESVAELFRLVKLHANNDNLFMFSSFAQIFDKQDLQVVAKYLFNKLIKKVSILEAKWAIRFVSVFTDETLEIQITEYIKELFAAKKYKEAKYFLLCMYHSQKEQAITFAKELIAQNNDWAKSQFHNMITTEKT